VIVETVTAGYMLTDPAYKRLYGPGVRTMDALGNLRVGMIGSSQYSIAHRVRAVKSGYLAAVKPIWAAANQSTSPGYSSGNGGVIRIRVYADDGTGAHAPNLASAPLAEAQHVPQLSNGAHTLPGSNHMQIALTSYAPLVEGKLYHIVYENIASDPANNFISIDNQVALTGNGRADRWLNPTDWAVQFGSRSGSGAYVWKDWTTTPTSENLYYSPATQLTMADGTIFGNGNMETGNVEGGRQWIIASNTPVRERFTPSQARSISALSFHTAASVAGSLLWEIRQGASVLASGMVSESTPNYYSQALYSGKFGVYKWYDVVLPQTLNLAAGTTYDVAFTPQGSSQWRFADQSNGSAYGFSFPAAFSDSQSQHYYNGTWINTNHWNHASSGSGSNWRVVLHLTPQ
jgi:hypothetical protein